MKVLIKCLLVVCVLSVSVNSYSQSDRYVEVVAIDTVVLKAISYTYEITSDQNKDMISLFEQQLETLEETGDYEPRKSLFEIATLLKKEKFNFSIGKVTKTPLSYVKSDSSIVVELKTEAELDRLIEFIREETSVKGSMKEVFYESAAIYQEKTYTTLYSRALDQANLIAKITNNEVGKVISVSENGARENSLAGLYGEIMEKAAFGLYGKNEAREKQEIVKMVFRFELKEQE